MRLGAHMSIEGGLDRAVDRARQAGCDVLQLFTKSSSQWRARDLDPLEIQRFHQRLQEKAIGQVSAHDSYLINLASPDEVLYRRSIAALIEELRRCEAIGIPSLIAHPGSHVGSGADAGVRRISAALDEVHAALPDVRTRVLLEVWAGQGSAVGSRFEELAGILSRVRAPERVGICFDTCHAFAAGYDLRTEEGYEATFERFDRLIGHDRIGAFHLNDSKGELGCRVDRHEHIGRGWIGLECFRLLVNDPRFADVPMYLETPKGPDLREDIENIAVLRSLHGDREAKNWTPPLGIRAPRRKVREAVETGFPDGGQPGRFRDGLETG